MDGYAVAIGFPALDGLVTPQFCPEFLGFIGIRDHTRFDGQVTCLLLKHRRHRFWHRKAWKALGDVTRSKRFNFQAMLLCTSEDSRNNLTVWCTDLNQANFMIQLSPACSAELVPQSIGSTQERYIVRM